VVTVLVDEGDTFLKDNDDLRGILNGGHDRMSAYVWRNVGDDHEPRRFKVWAPKAIAMIGQLPDTLEDRAIVVPLRRRRDGETVERFRADRLGQFLPMLSKAVRWGVDNLRALADRDPEIPENLDDRAQDNWRILIAIADQVGGRWPETARTASVALSSAAARGGGNVSRGVLLLRDIREVMGDRESMSSTALLEALIDMDEAPWREWRSGKPITTNSIARMLKPYKVGPHRGRAGSSYRASDLQDPWSRYLDPLPNGDDVAVRSATLPQSATEKPNDNNDVLHVAACGGPGEGAARVQDAANVQESSGSIRGAI
jgi:hypothetical protein